MKTRFLLLVSLLCFASPLNGNPIFSPGLHRDIRLSPSRHLHRDAKKPRIDLFKIADWIGGALIRGLEGVGSGASLGATFLPVSGPLGTPTAALGGAGFLEGVGFPGEGLNFYCGTTVAAGSDLQGSFGTYLVDAEGCNKDTYEGGFLSLTIAGDLPEIEIGVTGSISLGVDNSKMAAAIGGVVRKIEETVERSPSLLENAGKMLASWASNSPDSLLGDSLGPLQKDQRMMLGVLTQLTKKVASLGRVAKETLRGTFAGVQEFLKEDLEQYFRDPAKAKMRINPKTFLTLVADALKEIASNPKARKEDKSAAKFFSEILRDLASILTGCDSVTAGASVGVGFIPITAGLSYSNYVRLGSVSQALSNFARNNQDRFSAMVREFHSRLSSPTSSSRSQLGVFDGVPEGWIPEDLRTIDKVLTACTPSGFLEQCLLPSAQPLQELAVELQNTDIGRSISGMLQRMGAVSQ